MIASNTGWVHTISLSAPSLKDNTADADRLLRALKSQLGTGAIAIDLELLRRLPDCLRRWEFNLRCILFKDRHGSVLTGIRPAADSRPVAGLAVDLGTSRVVLRLLDLVSGAVLAESALDNPQIAMGSDILTRIHYAEQPDGLPKLNALIIDGLNRALRDLCGACQMEPQDVYALAVAGNTTMTHLFMGLNPRWNVREPYIPVVNQPGILRAAELGIQVNPSARMLIFPNIGSYFGGDLIAGILFAGMHRQEETTILVDVGTNA
ncbi:MAG: [Fe-S]-binding protein, partial [Desulfobacterales bacterium]